MRNRHFLLLDLLLLGPLPFAVLALRFESLHWSPAMAQAVLLYASVALPIRIGIAYASGIYNFIWKHASLVEMERLMYACALASTITFLLGAWFLRGLGLTTVRLPYSTLVWDALLSFNLMAAPRVLARLFEHSAPPRTKNIKRVIIAGAGALGQSILREVRTNRHLQLDVVGFVDDDPSKQRQFLGGLPVLGVVADLAALIPKHGIDEVVIAIPAARGSVVRNILHAATDAQISARIVPGMRDIISGKVRVQSLRQVEIEDLLRREPVVTDLNAVKSLSEGRTVLITGAGGSIGSELCRQIAELSPSVLVALDHSENQVFEIDNELRRNFPTLRIVPVIADIRDASRVHDIFGRYHPHAVFHAAAHKHVPLMEENVIEAVTNNVLGTRNVVDAAIDADVARLVFISTDKAVRPTSVMGATKRVAEQIVLHAAMAEQHNFASVRFGNVLGSRGSVIPTFLRQIKAGGPVTVTHPEMRRYFMTIPEAVQLVLQAGALGNGGELFVLDMGEPVKIVDLARDLIRLSGLEEGTDIEIAYSGIRPGEKLYEEVLFGHEDVRPTGHPKVLRSVGDATASVPMDQIEMLIRRVMSAPHDECKLREHLHTLVPDFAHEDARTNPQTRRASPYPTPPTAQPRVL